MTTQHTVDEADIRQRIDQLVPGFGSQPAFRKIEGDWLIARDHASVPLDFESGRALLNLEP
jgi:hypothetical protein